MSTLFSLDRWRPRHLLGAWVAYWAGLVGITLGPAIASILRVTGTEAGKGSVNAGFGDGAFTLSVIDHGATAWHGVASYGTVAWWAAGPPLLIWLAWLITRPKRPPEPLSDDRYNALAAGDADVMASRRARDEERNAR